MATLMDEIMQNYLVGKKPMFGSEFTPEEAAAQAARSQRALDRSSAVTGGVAALGGLRAAQTIGSGIMGALSRSSPSANSMLMEPAAGAAAQGALAQGSMMNAPTAAATMMTGAGLYPNFLPRRAEGDTGLSTPIVRPQYGYEGDSPRERNAVSAINEPRQSPWDETGIGAPYNPMAMVANAQRFPSMADRIKADPLAVAGANTPVVAGLDTTNRPAPIAGSAGVPNRPQGFFEQLFKGPQYQSNNLPVNAVPQGAMNFTGETMPSYINWGDPNSAADFFRADALLRQQNPSFFGLLGGNNG